MRDGGRHPERLKTVATGIMLAADQNGAKSFRKAHEHVKGHSDYHSLKIVKVQVGSSEEARTLVRLYACVDQSATTVIEADGTPTNAKHAKNRWPSIYSITGTTGDQKLLVSNVQQKAGTC
ncbi:hypothetical protein [Spelaeicoccus albus]|uniref:Uncharacterized protein n=1 Tax=Spelaeicoccus albus TaxID=1280376 RepID=A0A7Z0D331_9MICO|nr:hypothetical protein [Spelaeicoccus albus]NYI67928.1 hypothetical protein [Spelaeicoccus albus]